MLKKECFMITWWTVMVPKKRKYKLPDIEAYNSNYKC